tara:strand:- start:22 stop:372 length:351 start_codon:yes stop_codon:yes gene_type:complete
MKEQVEIAELKLENEKLKYQIEKLKDPNGIRFANDSESEDEVEDNDPEEYGEYMAKQHGKFPELMNGFDAETGEFKLPASIKKEDIEEKLAEVREYLGRFGGDETEVFDKIMKGLE